MGLDNPELSFRKRLQNNIFKFLIVSIIFSVFLFLIRDQGFFFGIK